MIRCWFKYLVFSLLLLFSFNLNVYGDANPIVYDVTSLKINPSTGTLRFNGWAYLSHYNNIGGGIGENSNMNISIVVSDGIQQYVVENKLKYGDNNLSRNLYLGLCKNGGILNDNKSKCVPESESTCHTKGITNGWGEEFLADNSCVVRNINFDVEIKIEDLVNKFSLDTDGEKELVFYIRIGIDTSCKVTTSKNTYSSLSDSTRLHRSGSKFGLECNGVIDYKDTKLAVHSNRIKGATVTLNSDGKGNIEVSGKYNFELLDISNKINIVDADDKIQRSSGNKYGDTIKFKSGINYIDTNYGIIPSSRYQVDMYAIKGYSYTPAYALASWFTTDGFLKLKIGKKKEEEIKTCSNKSKINYNPDCNNNSVHYSYTACKTYEKEVYVKSEHCDDICNDNYYFFGDEICYVNSKMTSNVNFFQDGDLNFTQSPKSPKLVYSGGPTKFYVEYTNYIYWFYKDSIIINEHTDYKEGTCIDENGISYPCCVTDTIAAKKAKEDETLYDSDEREYEDANQYIQKLTKDDLDTSYLNTLNSETSISVPADDIKGSWDGNVSELNNVINSGYWEENQKIYSDFQYDIYNAFIDRKTGNVTYGNGNDMDEDYLFSEKTYYIPLDKKSGLYNFKFEVSDLSVMKGGSSDLFKWTVNYNCGVECYQKFYNNEDDKGFKFNYRTIDLNNVFPNDNAGEQWKTWIISNSSYSSSGKLSLKNYNVENLTVNLKSDDIDNVRSYNQDNDYLNMDDIDTDGNSEYLSNFGTNQAIHYKLGCGSTSSRSECS